MAVLLPVLVEGVKSTNADLQLGSMILLTRLAGKAQLSNEAMDLVLGAIVPRRKNVEEGETVEAMLSTIIIICESQRTALPEFPKKALNNLVRLRCGLSYPSCSVSY